MKRYFLLLYIVIACNYFNAHAQEWPVQSHEPKDELVAGASLDFESNILINGMSIYGPELRGFLMKVSPDAEKLFYVEPVDSIQYNFRKVLQLNDSTYAATGSRGLPFTQTGTYFCRLDINGNMLWDTTYTLLRTLNPFNMFHFPEHNFLIIFGVRYDFPGDLIKPFVMKVTEMGEFIDIHYWIDDKLIRTYDMAKTSDDNLVFSYSYWALEDDIDSSNCDNTHLRTIKMTPDGDIIWESYEEYELAPEIIYHIEELSNGDILLCGDADTIFCLESNVDFRYAICLDSEGELRWKHFNDDWLLDTEYTSGAPIPNTNGHTLMVYSGDEFGRFECHLCKIDENGHQYWTKNLNISATAGPLLESPDGNLYLTMGYKLHDGGVPPGDAMVIKIDYDGNIVQPTSINELGDLGDLLKAFPNPTSHTITVINKTPYDKLTYSIQSTTGQQIIGDKLRIGPNQIHMPSQIVRGSYIITYSKDEQPIYSEIIIIEK